MSRLQARNWASWGLLRRYLGVVLSAALVAVLVAFAVTWARPTSYTSSSRVVVNPGTTTGTPVVPDMGTEQQIAMSGNVARVAAARLGMSQHDALAGLSVTNPVATTILQLSYSASTPRIAQKGAAAFTTAYVDYLNVGSGGRSPVVAGVITPANLPVRPDPANYPLTLGVALLLGLAVGVGAAFLWDRKRDRLRGIGDVEAHTGLPVLASVPAFRQPDFLSASDRGTEEVAEVYGLFATQLPGVLRSRGGTSILVTSPSDGAGKSTTSAQLAASLALMGKEVVLVRADLRRPAVNGWFDLPSAPGLTDVLDGRVDLKDAVRATNIEGLRVVNAGSPRLTGHTYFNTTDLHALLGRLTATSVVILDAPTVLRAAETAQIAEQVGLVLLVVDVRNGLRADAEGAVAALGHVRDKLVGCVANEPAPKSGPKTEPATQKVGQRARALAGRTRTQLGGLRTRRRIRQAIRRARSRAATVEDPQDGTDGAVTDEAALRAITDR